MTSDDDHPADPDATLAPRSRVHGGATTLPAAGGAARAPFAAGALIAGRYQVVRFIASGGMGEVYEVEDLELGQRVALKTLRPDRAQAPRELERLKREIVLARGVTHPSICRLFDVGFHTTEAASLAFLTMELLDGPTLADELRQRGPMAPARARAILRHLAAALAAAHAVDVIHRDFKSQNIILVERGGETVPVVTDFGLAWRESEATVTDRFAGTPAYMAPEQVLGDAPTAATDVYALGVVAFELVSGVLPFAGASGLAIALAKTREAARSVRTVAPAVEPRWAHAIARALERDPARRWQSPGELVAALDAPAPSRRWLALALPLGLGAAVAVTALAARDGAIEIPPLRDPAGRLALQIGGLGQDIVEGVRVDRAGTLFAVGHFSAPFTFRGARLAPPVSGAQAGFAIAVAPDGGVRWTRVFGGRLDAMATAVAVTDDGDVLVGGTVRGPVDFGGAAGMLTPAGRADGFVVRLGGADGATRWVWRTGAQGAGQVRGLAVADDAVFAAGDYAGTAELGTGRVAATRADDRSGPFVVRLDRDGRPTWIHAPEGTGDGRCWRVALGDASVFAVGFFTGELGGLRAVGSADAMITRLDAATGAVRWTRAFGGAALDELGGVAYAEGRLAVTGDYGGDGRWGQTALVGGGNADLVVAELDPADGEPRWVRGFPAPDYQQGRVVGFAPDGAVRVAARMNGALTLAAPDAALPLHFDGEDVALFTFARTGAVVAARAWAGGGSARPRDMLIAPDGRVTLAGMFRALELDADQTLHAEGTADGFVLEVAP